MTVDVRITHCRRYVAGICTALAILVEGCATQEQIGAAINDVNKAFRAEYETVLAEKGTRVFKLGRAEAFGAISAAMARLGMLVESQDAALGFMNVYAPAPRPLDLDEWRRTAESDLPKLREIARPHVGMLSDFIRFEPEGLQIVINATAVEVAAGTEISLTMRMREIAPPRSGMPRREYAPPTAVRLGLDKIWAAFEQELGAARSKP